MSKQDIPRWVTFFIIFFLQVDCFGLCVKGSKANLRTQPSSNSSVSWVVSRYMPFIRIDSQGNWLQVMDMDGEKHWIYSSLLTQKFQCAVIKVSRTNVRSGPGTQFGFADYRTAIKYEAFQRVDKKGSWYRLANELGNIGWVHENSLWLPIRKVRVTY